MQSSASINLVKRKVNLLDEILRWALSVGRLLVIITEIVAFSTFIYRFSLDRTLIDLHTEIKNKQAIVESLKERENTYRRFQERILVASITSQQAGINVKILNDIVELTPPEITLISFSIVNVEATIDIYINSVSSLSNFISVLRAYSGFSSVNIKSIQSNISGTSVKVTILAKLKK
mgnify:FL=1